MIRWFRMVHISRIYTRSGDTGETMLANGTRASKSSARICTYGDVDELNSTVGLVRLELSRDPKLVGHEDFATTVDAELGRIQQELFNLGAELATPGATRESTPVVQDHHVERLEQEIDAHNAPLEPLRSFVLPGGGPVGTTAHLARTVCRRAERNLIALSTTEDVRGETIRYLNRLSDYLFVLSRAASHTLGYDEILWDPKST